MDRTWIQRALLNQQEKDKINVVEERSKPVIINILMLLP